MQPAESFEKIAVLRCGICNPGIAQHQGEDRCERSPENHDCKHTGDSGTVKLLHKDRRYELRGLSALFRRYKLTPRNHANDSQVNSEVDHSHGNKADQDRSWNYTPGLFNLVADVADVVIAETIVHTDARGRTQP